MNHVKWIQAEKNQTIDKIVRLFLTTHLITILTSKEAWICSCNRNQFHEWNVLNINKNRKCEREESQRLTAFPRDAELSTLLFYHRQAEYSYQDEDSAIEMKIYVQYRET